EEQPIFEATAGWGMMPLAAGRKRLGLPWLGGTPSTLKALVNQRSKSTTANSEMGPKKKSTTLSQDGAHRYIHRAQDELSEAYVTLGRLKHVKARHTEAIQLIEQSFMDTGAAIALDSAMKKIHQDYEALRENLEMLYRTSMADLQTHKLTMEGATRARIELLAGQHDDVLQVENDLKTLMTCANGNVLLRELPIAMQRANRTLKASLTLIGLRLPEMKPITAEDFPSGRLHDVVIAPKQPEGREGSRGQADGGEERSTKQQQHAQTQTQSHQLRAHAQTQTQTQTQTQDQHQGRPHAKSQTQDRH
ncbi:unnamed protein product, partial [Pylaiella littoralis]